MVQHDAVLATLALLQPQAESSAPEQRLTALYPQILGAPAGATATPNGPTQRWACRRRPVPRAVRRPALAGLDLAGARYQLVLAAEPTSFALQMDLRAHRALERWPMAPDTSPVRVTLEHDSQSFVVQPGAHRGGVAGALTFTSTWRFGQPAV